MALEVLKRKETLKALSRLVLGLKVKTKLISERGCIRKTKDVKAHHVFHPALEG